MDKIKQKRPTYNQDFILALKTKYGFTESYIRKSINGDRVGVAPIKIKEDYDNLVKQSKANINQQMNKL
jgi:hypothetical protein